MNTRMYKNVNVIMIFVMLVSALCFISMDCSGFWDYATIKRCFFACMSVLSGSIALLTMKKAWLIVE